MYDDNGKYVPVHLRKENERGCVYHDALDFIMNELKAMWTEMQEIKDTVGDISKSITQMRENTGKIINVAVDRVALNFEQNISELADKWTRKRIALRC